MENRAEGHARSISRPRRWTASTALLLIAGCTDLGLPGDATLSTSALVILPLQSSAPPPPVTTFTVHNDRTTTRQILHPDAFNTPFLTLTFRAGALASLNGVPLTTTDSVAITVQPEVATYGFTVSPNSLAFGTSVPPSARVSYDQYGDLTVHAQSGRYTSPAELADALSLWYEISPDRWRRVSGSGPAGLDAVTGSLDQPGTYVVAAPR